MAQENNDKGTPKVINLAPTKNVKPKLYLIFSKTRLIKLLLGTFTFWAHLRYYFWGNFGKFLEICRDKWRFVDICGDFLNFRRFLEFLEIFGDF